MKTTMTILALLLASLAQADEDDSATDTWGQRCECTAAQRDYFRHHKHKNRFFGFAEKCCTGTDCHCQDRW